MKCNLDKLMATSNGIITQCMDCQRIALRFKTLVIGFDINQFYAFTGFLSKVNFDNYCIKPFEKPAYLVFNTCHQDIQFALDKGEFEEFNDLVQQAALMLEVLDILG